LNKFICIGDSGVDRYVKFEALDANLAFTQPGGCALNVAWHLKHTTIIPTDVSLWSPLGNDLEADEVIAFTESNALAHHFVICEGRTPVQWIRNRDNGEKDFLKYETGILEDYRLQTADALKLNRADVIITVRFEQMQKMSDSFFEQQLSPQLVCDFMNLDDSRCGLSNLGHVWPTLSLAWFGLDASQQELLAELASLSFEQKLLVVATLGAQGTIAFQEGKQIEMPAQAVPTVVDTTGAGDASLAVFCAEYFEHGSLEQSLKQACQAGAKTVQHRGAIPVLAPI
jgi:sugar/nucleoside kinase (ribokinase family)